MSYRSGTLCGTYYRVYTYKIIELTKSPIPIEFVISSVCFRKLAPDYCCCGRAHRGPKFTFFCSGPEIIKLVSCSTQLSMEFSLLINMKMPTIVGIFIFICRENFILNYV